MRLNPSTLIRTAAAALLLLASAVVPSFARQLGIEVWTDRGDDAVYEPGDAMRVKIRTSDDAYLLVYEIDSEGGVNLLYPWRRGIGKVQARNTLRLPEDNSNYQLVVEHATGQGFIVAVASEQPFRELPWFLRPFDPQAASVGYEGDPEGRDKEEEGFDEKGHVVGDPYVAMERIRRRVLTESSGTENFATAYSTYYVHEQVRYPRYLCNDCHRPTNWAWWNGFDPYYSRCSVIDFRVNWGWCWGPQMWTTCVPYYYYVVRSDCPPRYQSWYNNRARFSSWDGWNRWNSLWGGQLRRVKPAPAPVGYAPPPPRGTIWRGGQTPPGFVPPDVRRQTGPPSGGPQSWLNRDRGDGKPVWREAPRLRPNNGGGNTSVPAGPNRERPAWRDWGQRRGADPQPAQGGGQEGGGQGEQGAPRWRPSDPPRNDPPSNSPPRQDPPRQDPPRDPPPPQWRQPPSDPPKWSPPPPKSFQPKGHGGNGNG
jgi:uncharacterized protein DUF4384